MSLLAECQLDIAVVSGGADDPLLPVAEGHQTRSDLYYDESVPADLIIRHPQLSMDFLAQLEVRAVCTFQEPQSPGPASAATGGIKTEWLSKGFYWNGHNCHDSSVFAFDSVARVAVIRLKVHVPSAQRVGYNRLQIVVGLLWKPSVKLGHGVSDGTGKLSSSVYGRRSQVMLNLSDNLPTITDSSKLNVDDLPFEPTYRAPLKRTLTRSFNARSAFTARLVVGNLSNEVQSNILLLVDLENTCPHSLVVSRVDIVAAGFMVSPLSAAVPGNEVVELKASEVYGLLYRLTFNDRMTDGGDATRPSIVDLKSLTAAERIRNARIHVEASVDGQKMLINADWAVDIDEEGNAVTAASSGGDALPGQNCVESMAGDIEGLAISFTALSPAFIHRLFTVKVLVSNQTSRVRNLKLVFPSASTSAAESHDLDILAARLSEMGADDDHHHLHTQLAMDAVEFLDKYDQVSARSSALICLENNIQVNGLKAQSSASFHAHFLPIRGAGTLQSVDLVQCIDEDTGFSSDIVNALELLVNI